MNSTFNQTKLSGNLSGNSGLYAIAYKPQVIAKLPDNIV